MRVKRCRHQAGDTLIEVMLATAVFSAVAVGCLTVMNRGLSIAQQSLESTLVRQQIDAQAEMLRFVHNNSHKGDAAMAELWSNLPKKDAANEVLSVDTCPDHFGDGEFALRSRSDSLGRVSTYMPAQVYAKQEGDVSYGISVQLVHVTGGSAYDAYIQACWYAPSQPRPVTIGTIVRLYAPEKS